MNLKSEQQHVRNKRTKVKKICELRGNEWRAIRMENKTPTKEKIRLTTFG